MTGEAWREVFEHYLENRGISDVWQFSVEEYFQAQTGWRTYVQCSFAR